MDQMFSAYGEITPSDEPYCESISLEHIEKLAVDRLENFKESDYVYLSNDLYADLMKQFGQTTRFSGPNGSYPQGNNLVRITTSAGPLEIKRVAGLTNFCHVGTATTFEHLEWIKVGIAFEEVFFGEEA